MKYLQGRLRRLHRLNAIYNSFDVTVNPGRKIMLFLTIEDLRRSVRRSARYHGVKVSEKELVQCSRFWSIICSSDFRYCLIGAVTLLIGGLVLHFLPTQHIVGIVLP